MNPHATMSSQDHSRSRTTVNPWQPNRLRKLLAHTGWNRERLSQEIEYTKGTTNGWFGFCRPGPDAVRKLNAIARREKFEL